MPPLTLTSSEVPRATRAKALVFEDPCSRALLTSIETVAPSEAAILLSGETGTGKEIVARHIHAMSLRSTGPFVAVNCGAFSESLVESELFGHERGAFTGASQAKAGWFEAARGGTLFLDEVGDLPLAMQVKLLRVLQENEVVRLGSRQPIPVDVRVVSATNVDLREAMLAGHFREDLFYRLNVVGISIEPLRHRPGDIVPLAHYFIGLYRSRLRRGEIELSERAAAALRAYAWPGNIRELENAIHHALLVCRHDRIEAEDLRIGARGTLESQRKPQTTPPQAKATTEEQALAALEGVFTNLFEVGVDALHDRVQEALFRTAYNYCEHNQIQTGRLLGVSRNVVRARLIQFGALNGRAGTSGSSPPPPDVSRDPEQEAPSVLPPGNVPTKVLHVRSANEGTARSSTSIPLSEPASRNLRVGYQRFGQLLLVQALGALDSCLAERGLGVDWTEFPAGLELVDELQRGTLDIGVVGECPPLFAQADSAPIVYIASEASAPEAEAILIPRGSDLGSVRDLRGKTIALSRGSNVHYLLIRALDEVGLSYADVCTTFLSPEEAERAFESGEVDAWAIWEPLLSSVQKSKGARVLRDGRGLTLNSGYYVARRELWEKQPDLVEEVLAKVDEAAHFARAHAGAAARLLSKSADFEPEALEQWLRKLSGIRRLNPTHVLAQQEIADRLRDLELVPRAAQVSAAEFWPSLARVL